MSQYEFDDTVFSRRLVLVGDFNQPRVDFLNTPEKFSQKFPELNQVPVCYCTVTQLDELLAELEDALTVVVSDAACVLNKADMQHYNSFFIACNDDSQANVLISKSFSSRQFLSAINMGFDYLLNQQQILALSKDVATVTQERKEISEIGIALSAEKNLEKLLSMVLKEGRKLGNCEAASLYLLINPNSNNPELLFKLTQNSEIEFDFKEQRFPLTNQSLAGYVALNGEILNIADAHQLPRDLPYHFDQSFDRKTGYRTRQMLVLPMRNHKGKIIGVLQFINNKNRSTSLKKQHGFSQERQELLLSLACQAAVAIDNSQLIDSIESLFEGFVAASVKAIESRDPVTSGHSFRVAEYTTGLAKMIDVSCDGIYRNTNFSTEQLREIRYASLLHDFGKVGVKEDVLLKANKLHESRYNYLDLKIEWQKQLVQRKFYQQLLMSNQSREPKEWKQLPEYQAMQNTLRQLENYQKVLMQANKPSLLESEVAMELKQLFDFRLDDSCPHNNILLNEKDFLSLSITKGSLTNEERQEIQSHVVHTQEFLMAIPWTEELAAVPVIAGSHHEKLDGSGYPCGLVTDDIPVASKIMAIADIYDALTARDRPYKKAVKVELALDILNDEANKGKLCQTMVDTFIGAKVYKKINLS